MCTRADLSSKQEKKSELNGRHERMDLGTSRGGDGNCDSVVVGF